MSSSVLAAPPTPMRPRRDALPLAYVTRAAGDPRFGEPRLPGDSGIRVVPAAPTARSVQSVQSVPSARSATRRRTAAPVAAAASVPTFVPAVVPARAAAPVRLTRRGRVAVVLLLLAGLVVGGFLLGRASQGRAAAAPASAVVEPGDTLWTIAARVEPDRDTRVVVAEIVRANHLSSASLQVGQRLVVPAA